MADNLSIAAGKLRRSSERLNNLTDQAARTVKELEKFLGEECSVGLPVSVFVRSWDDSQESQHLEYRRVGSHFRIAVVWIDHSIPEENVSVKPWSDCSRE